MSGDTIPEDFLKNFDVQLQEFYHRVICKEMSLQQMWKKHGVNRALTKVVEAYSKDTVSKGDSSIEFDDSSKRCAYIIKHSTCFTSAVASYLMKLANKNMKIVHEILEKKKLSICCLGGGPATDAVAVIKIFSGIYHPRYLCTGEKLEIEVTVVDLSENWHKTAKNVFQCLEEASEFFSVDEFTLTYKFIKADLTQEMDKELTETIRNADVITLIYFLSAVNGSKAQDKSLPMMQNILLNMKKGAFLFFLDSAADHHYKVLNKAAERRRSMEEIYGPLVEEFHTISLESVNKFMDLYAKLFNKFFCMTNIFLCVSSWYKNKVIHPRAGIRKQVALEPIVWQTPTQEESDELTEKMRVYRARVKKLVKAKYFTIREREILDLKGRHFQREHPDFQS